MTFVQRTDWQDDVAGGTPVMAADLLRIEQGIADAQHPPLAPVASSGDYADLTNKPALATVATTGSYTDLSGKPALATVATSGNYSDLSGTPTVIALAGDLGGTAAAPTVTGGTHHTHTKAQITDFAVAYADQPAGTTITVLKSGSTWPARPTARTDIIVAWKGADPSPAIVSSGTGGMLNNVDYRLVTP